MSTPLFIQMLGGSLSNMKPRPCKILPVVVVNSITDRVDVRKELEQYNITAPIEVYTISQENDTWYFQYGASRLPLPCRTARELALWLKKELENEESEMIPTPYKGYRPVLCLLGLSNKHISMFREGRTGSMYVLTECTGPTLPRDTSVGLRQFYRNVDTGTYGPYHDKVVFSPDGKITIEGCKTEYTHKLGLAVAACLSTRTCSLYRTV